MYLARVEAQNFRIFEDFSVDLNRGLNLLIGENSSGKTALIDAIRLVLDTNSAEWVRFSEIDFRQGTDSLKIQLKFADMSDQDAAVFAEHLTFEEGKSILYITLTATIGTYTGRTGQFIKTEMRSGANSEGPVIERDARMYLSTTYLKPLRDAQNEMAAGRSSRLSQLLASQKSVGGNSSDIQALLQAVIGANQTIKDHQSVTSATGAIEDILKQLIFQADRFSPTIGILGCKTYDDMTDTEKRASFKSILERLSLNLDDSGKLHGLGYSNLLFMAAELMLLTLKGENFPLLLIEEPEAHLHPQLQMKFLKYLATPTPKPDIASDDDAAESSLQCILSTHSPNLASKAPLESLILMNRGKAYPLRRGCTQLEPDDYPFLEKFLDVTKANMFFAKGILLVEGDGENILLPTIAELIGRPLENYGVSIVNMGNLAYKRYARIYRAKDSSVVLPVRVACITDLDLWPNKAEAREGNIAGFKERKSGNRHYWLNHYNTPESLEEYKGKKRVRDGENVKTFISDDWTFEYCLAKYGLSKLVYAAINGSSSGYDELPEDTEDKAIKIYGLIENKSSGKTEATYRLVRLIEEEYSGQPDKLRKDLPPYIVEAIEYVTAEFPTDSSSENRK